MKTPAKQSPALSAALRLPLGFPSLSPTLFQAVLVVQHWDC